MSNICYCTHLQMVQSTLWSAMSKQARSNQGVRFFRGVIFDVNNTTKSAGRSQCEKHPSAGSTHFCETNLMLLPWCLQAGSKQPGKVCHSGGRRLNRTKGGHAVSADGGGHFRRTSTGPRWDPDREGKNDCSGFAL